MVGRTLAALWTLVLAVGVTPALAVHTSGDFELDGDAINGGAAGDDWSTVVPPASPPAGSDVVFATGEVPNKSFVVGTKDLDDISSAGVTSTVWNWDEHSVPDKDHLTNAYAIRYPDGHLYFGADRFANNGDAMIGFWFFQSGVSLNLDGTFSGVHTVGDLLIISNFLNGGKTSEIKVYKWDPESCTAVDGCPTLQRLTSGLTTGTAVCNPAGGGFAADIACAVTNPSRTPAPWSYTPKSGSPGTFPPLSFFEGGVDLAALGLAGECFASFLAETRSSQEVTASSKDFILHAFQPCVPALTVTKECVAAVDRGGASVSVTFRGEVCNTGTDDLTGVSVRNDKGGVTTPPSPTLAIGACSPYGGSYTSTSLSNTDTVTATGTGVRSGTATSTTATAACFAEAHPSCSVSKNCQTVLVTDNARLTVKATFDGQVCNTGSVVLSSVTLLNDKAGVTTPPASTLAPGACSPYSGSYFPTSLSGPDGTATDTVTVGATGALGSGPAACTTTHTCNLCPLPQ